EDKFGDNGIVSVVIGEKQGDILDIQLWLMSCRVLKREMEYAMLDMLAEKAKEQGLSTLQGHYYPTAKNSMVKELYRDFGFEKISGDEQGNTLWSLDLNSYRNKTSHIKIN
ncbi:MAG: HAD family hydrolase, partial [Oscillospiraceae bacterium]|nr:HAD family hydrolase [Oscillospiraceae bacterium]